MLKVQKLILLNYRLVLLTTRVSPSHAVSTETKINYDLEVKMIKQIINKIKGEEKPNTTQVLIGQLTYVEDWKKEDFLSEYPNLDNEGKFIVQV